jgi:hypothetical protein
MDFAKYYNVTNKLNKMLKEGKLNSYEEGLYKGLYICEDTHDIWISRILEGYNSEFEKEDGKWLVERNKISKYDLCEFLKDKKKDDSKIDNRQSRDFYIDNCFELDDIIENIILMDDANGLEGWDNYEADSLEEAIEAIDGGYGIIEYKEAV